MEPCGYLRSFSAETEAQQTCLRKSMETNVARRKSVGGFKIKKAMETRQNKTLHVIPITLALALSEMGNLLKVLNRKVTGSGRI